MRNSRMGITAILSLILALVLPFAVFGQTTAGTARIGDKDVDAAVAAVDQEGAANPTALLTKLSTEYNVALPDLQGLLSQGYKPGELWLALELAKASGKSFTEVIALTKGKAGHGWGVVAQSLGIKPGSKEFAALRTDASMKMKGGAGTADQSSGKPAAGGGSKPSMGGSGSGDGGRPAAPAGGGTGPKK